MDLLQALEELFGAALVELHASDGGGVQAEEVRLADLRAPERGGREDGLVLVRALQLHYIHVHTYVHM